MYYFLKGRFLLKCTYSDRISQYWYDKALEKANDFEWQFFYEYQICKFNKSTNSIFPSNMTLLKSEVFFTKAWSKKYQTLFLRGIHICKKIFLKSFLILFVFWYLFFIIHLSWKIFLKIVPSDENLIAILILFLSLRPNFVTSRLINLQRAVKLFWKTSFFLQKEAIKWYFSLLYLNRPKRFFFEKDRPLTSISLYEKFVYSFQNLQNKIFFLKIYSQIKSYNIFITTSSYLRIIWFGKASLILRIYWLIKSN